MNTWKTLKRISLYLKPYRWQFVFAVICMTLVAGLTALPFTLIKPLLDKGFIGKDLPTLQRIIILLPLIFLAKGLFAYLQNYIMAAIGIHIVADLRKHVFNHLQILSLDYFNAQSTAKILSRLTNDIQSLNQALSRTPIFLMRDGLTAIFLMSVLFTRSVKFTLFTLLILPFFAILITTISKKIRKKGRRGQEQMGEVYTVLQENLQTTPLIRSYNGESLEINRFQQANERYVNLMKRLAKTDNLTSPLMELVGSLIACLLFWKGGRDVAQGVWTTGDFMSFLGAAFAMYKPLRGVADMNSQIQLAVVSTERLFEVLDTPARITSDSRAPILHNLSDSIVYKSVSFQYPGASTDAPKTVLDQLSCTIKKGEILALVGPSGAGKTTVAMLLPRFYDPSQGEILWDGKNIKTYQLASLRNLIGVVTQDVLLFNESVSYNLRYGKPDATLDEIQAAAKLANAHDFVMELPQGYDTPIGERGVRLSGGQRQRLSIARALLKNPPLLIFDEATSALDAENERLVQEAIERLMNNRTVIVIAHRLATIRKANRILVIEDGKIVEEGNHDALISKQGSYWKLHQLQTLQ